MIRAHSRKQILSLTTGTNEIFLHRHHVELIINSRHTGGGRIWGGGGEHVCTLDVQLESRSILPPPPLTRDFCRHILSKEAIVTSLNNTCLDILKNILSLLRMLLYKIWNSIKSCGKQAVNCTH